MIRKSQESDHRGDLPRETTFQSDPQTRIPLFSRYKKPPPHFSCFPADAPCPWRVLGPLGRCYIEREDTTLHSSSSRAMGRENSTRMMLRVSPRQLFTFIGATIGSALSKCFFTSPPHPPLPGQTKKLLTRQYVQSVTLVVQVRRANSSYGSTWAGFVCMYVHKRNSLFRDTVTHRDTDTDRPHIYNVDPPSQLAQLFLFPPHNPNYYIRFERQTLHRPIPIS